MMRRVVYRRTQLGDVTMAKMYEALKQVEAERSRQAQQREVEIEDRLARVVDERAEALGRELNAALNLLGQQLRRDNAALHRRLTALCVVVALGVVLLLARG
jgi:hypothetical protein